LKERPLHTVGLLIRPCPQSASPLPVSPPRIFLPFPFDPVMASRRHSFRRKNVGTLCRGLPVLPPSKTVFVLGSGQRIHTCLMLPGPFPRFSLVAAFWALILAMIAAQHLACFVSRFPPRPDECRSLLRPGVSGLEPFVTTESDFVSGPLWLWLHFLRLDCLQLRILRLSDLVCLVAYGRGALTLRFMSPRVRCGTSRKNPTPHPPPFWDILPSCPPPVVGPSNVFAPGFPFACLNSCL